MQTISVPYTTDEDSRAAITRLRRIQSAAVRTAYANAVGPDGKRLKQKDLRDLAGRGETGRCSALGCAEA